MSQQPIQCSIGGFSGAPITLFSALDESTGLLTIAAISALHKDRRAGCLVISNVRGLERDMAFTDEQIREAIDAWQAIRHDTVDGGASRLIYTERARRADPSSMIEPDGLDERGRKYRLAEHVGNEAVATLATCLWVSRSVSRADVLDTAADLAGALLSGQAISIAGFQPWEIQPVFHHGYQVDQRAAGAYWDKRDR